MNFKDYKKAKKQDKPQSDPMDNLDAGAKMLLSNFVKDYEGKSYQEIAQMLDRHVKSIDNALQRVKRKLEKYLEDTKDE